MYIDTHAHLYLDQFKEDRDAVMRRAEEAQISRIYLPNIDSSTTESLKDLCTKYPVCRPMMGLHPCSVKENYLMELDHVKAQLSAHSFVAVGEIGIDLYWDKTFLAEQQESFRVQSVWAYEKDLPIVIHSRESIDMILDLLDDLQLDGLKGIFHCFGSGMEQAERIIDHGFLMGIGGVVTFKNSTLGTVLSEIDLSHLVLETDAPYLTPHPHRGKRNESSYLLLVAQKLADIYGVNREEIAAVTTANALRLFGEESV